MSAQVPPAEIVAIAYGEVEVKLGCVLTQIWVRVREPDGNVVIGARDPVLVHFDILAGLAKFEPELLAMFAERQATRDALRPVSAPLADWDSGPALSAPNAYQYFCSGWGYVDVDAALGALRLWFEAKPIAMLVEQSPGEAQGAEYLMAHRTLASYHRGLRNVIRKMEQAGVNTAPNPH
ncbi:MULTISPECIES: hypothetical protein [Luteimonas]|uniref:hypothetical protein n=1 Tax=Luteimonas TaxID=83614 RepID=UPI000C7CE81A|nr:MULTISPECIES: hypothetical protein [Luteimonas]